MKTKTKQNTKKIMNFIAEMWFTILFWGMSIIFLLYMIRQMADYNGDLTKLCFWSLFILFSMGSWRPFMFDGMFKKKKK